MYSTVNRKNIFATAPAEKMLNLARTCFIWPLRLLANGRAFGGSLVLTFIMGGLTFFAMQSVFLRHAASTSERQRNDFRTAVPFNRTEICNLVDESGALTHDFARFPYRPALPDVHLLKDDWCFDYAASFVDLRPEVAPKNVVFHTYWRADLSPFSGIHYASVRSFIITQDPSHTLTIWTNNATALAKHSKQLAELMARFPDRIVLSVYDSQSLSIGTPVEDSPLLSLKDEMAWLDGDLGRYLILYKFGGIWVDMDTLYLRNFAPLLRYEFLQDMECNHDTFTILNGAIMRFEKESPYLCIFLREIAQGGIPSKNSFDWGSSLYYRIYRRLSASKLPTFGVIPWCFTDPTMCDQKHICFPNLFATMEGGVPVQIQERIEKIFALHWHNQHKKVPEEDSIFQYVDKLHADIFARNFRWTMFKGKLETK